MQIRYFLNNLWCCFLSHHNKRIRYNLDGKQWIQNILLKNQLKSLNKSD